jgi:hypothetical protein
MDELYELFNQLSEKQRKLVLATPTLLDAFCCEASDKIGIDTDILKAHMMKLEAFANGEVERVVKLSKSVEVLKDKSMRLIERQSDREMWYNEMIITPMIEALTMRELLDSGKGYDEAQEILSSAQCEELKVEVKKRIENASDLSSLVRRPTLVRWDDGSSRTEREKKATLYHEILNIMKTDEGDGYTKTELLRKLKKDNSSWRAMCNEVLKYMESREIIIKQNRKYFYSSTFHSREHGYHRTVYELLVDESRSKTSILKVMGYNNSKGRVKLSNALNQLMIEGLISTDGKRWSVI